MEETLSYLPVESTPTFEHVNLELGDQSWVRSINHRFTEDAIIESIYKPGVYISMIGKCEAETLNNDMGHQRDFSYQYMVAIVDQPCSSQMRFSQNCAWQMLSVMLPLDKLQEKKLIPEFQTNIPHNIPQVRLAETAPAQGNILRACEAVWQCTFEGIERELFIKAKALEVLALFLHSHRQDKKTLSHPRMLKLSKVLNQIEQNLEQDWNLSSVTHLAESNRTYVKNDIKQLTGDSFQAWLKKIRLEKACQQLAGQTPISEIANNVGFRSQAHFSTLFKNEVGLTPREYRRSFQC